jgi:uncharacterized protein (TIGR03084 family)
VEPVVTALGEEQHELDVLLSGLDDEEWARPSSCPGWTVSDVILHLAQTEELVVASGEHRFAEATAPFGFGPDGRARAADDAVALMVQIERGASGPEVHLRWRAAAESALALLGACDARRRLPWVSGEVSARTAATTRLAETWIHAGDVAWAFGVDLVPTGRLWHVVRLAWRTLPYDRATPRPDHGLLPELERLAQVRQPELGESVSISDRSHLKPDPRILSVGRECDR